MTTARRARILGATLLFAVPLGLTLAAPPDAPPAAADPLKPTGPADAAAGFAACAACHNAGDAKMLTGSGEPRDGFDPKDHPFATRYGSNDYILLSEGRTWPRNDPHAVAYRGVTSDLGQKMLVRMRRTDDAAWIAKSCATCHAVDTLAGDTSTPPFDGHPTRIDSANGVSCAACHGVKAAWQVEHYAERTDQGMDDGKPLKSLPWRDRSPEAKLAAGLRDLRDPAVKAQLCVSCHVGSDALSRVVTHDMYAAGHPPLPPFELSTYLDGEPRHWAPTSQLAYFAKFDGSPAKLWERYHALPAGAEVTAARELAAGAVAALRAEALLLQAGAEQAKERDGIDFARFDCLACHHDLKTPSDRQDRDPKRGPPGRPTLRPSIAVLAAAVATHAGQPSDGPAQAAAAGFEGKWNALQAAAVARPFGDVAAVRAAAADLVQWCDAFLAVQSRTAEPLYPEAGAAALRATLRDAALGEANRDPEAAMVLAWAYGTLGKATGSPPADDRLAALAKVLPLSVRDRPDPSRRDPAPLDWVARQQQLNAYRVVDFVAAFRALTGEK